MFSNICLLTFDRYVTILFYENLNIFATEMWKYNLTN